MANFAKEQLMKYGWTEGKGLGKNENGITEPLKLSTNQSRTGIGYDGTKPWWEKLFNNTTKNIKIESHGDEISLSVVNFTDDSRSISKIDEKPEIWHYWHWKGSVDPCVCREMSTGALRSELTQLKLNTTRDKTVHETIEPVLSGKLERIAEQDRILLNKSSLNTTPAGENDMAYRKKTNAESDVEENEHETDSKESTLRSKEERYLDVRSKSTKKKHRRRINKLVEQLGTCNLEDGEGCSNTQMERRRKSNSEANRHDFLNNRRLCHKMKKSKEKRVDSNILLNYLKNATNKSDLIPFVSQHGMSPHECYLKRLQILFETNKRINQFNTVSQLGRCENEKDSVGHKIELSPELRNSIGRNEVADKLCKDWLIIDLEAERRQRDIDYTALVPICSPSQGVSKLKNVKKSLKHSTFSIDERDLRKQYIHRLNDKIQKKKDQRYRSKHMKKITAKLKGETLEHELNSVIKSLTEFGLTEEVNANTIKKRPTQTHLTPV